MTTEANIQSHVDSVFVFDRDSIYVMKSDTFTVEKHYYIRYRDRVKTDSVVVRDTFVLHESLAEVKEVSGTQNRLSHSSLYKLILIVLVITGVIAYIKIKKI